MSAQRRGPRWPTTATDNGTSCGWPPTAHAAGTAEWERYWRGRMREARIVFLGQLAEHPMVPFRLTTQRELAKMCGIGLTTWRGWEGGRRKGPRAVLAFLRWAAKENLATFRRAVEAKRAELRDVQAAA